MKCFKCKKRGHFTTVCKNTKNADQVDREEMSDNEEVFLGAISTSANTGSWMRPLSVDSATVTFKINTGADVSILPFNIYQEKLNHKPLFPVSATLRGPGGNRLEVLGYIKCKLSYKETHVNSDLYVTKASKALPGRGDCVVLGLVKLTDSVDNFPQLFKGLGTMPDPYTIKLKENATPFAVMTPRRMSLLLMPKVKQELDRLSSLSSSCFTFGIST